MAKTVELLECNSFFIYPKKPFNFEGTFFKPSHFPSKLVVYDKRNLIQGIRINGEFFGLVISDAGTKRAPCISVKVYSSKGVSNAIQNRIKDELMVRYDLDVDIADFGKHFRSDEILAKPLKKWEGMRPSTAYSLYGFLMVATVLQNATVGRSIKMMDSLLQNYGVRLIFQGYEVFEIWEPRDIEKVTEEELRNLRIGYRAKIIKKISYAFASGEIDEKELRKIKDREIIANKLRSLYGVGPQSVSYILFEVFHFYDALNHLSPWERKIVSMLLFGKKTVPVERIITFAKKRWGQWCMLAVHYLFEDLFWRSKKEQIPWLEEEIRK